MRVSALSSFFSVSTFVYFQDRAGIASTPTPCVEKSTIITLERDTK